MRKLLSFFSFFVLTIIFDQYLFAENSSFTPFTGKVIADKVRIRTTPDLEGHILNQINKETLLLIVGEKNDFYAIKPSPETKLYIFRSYVIDNIIEANQVNVRLKPDLNSPILGQLKNKQKIEGTVYKNDSKWLEISPPEGISFYVAKDYISKAGDASYYALMTERKEEVAKILNSAFFITQAECKKPYDEMDTKKAVAQFDAVIKGYSDFPEYVQQAKEGLALLQDNYLQKKIVYLETKANMAPEEKEEIFKEVASLKANQVHQKSVSATENNSKTNIFEDNSMPVSMKEWVPVEKEIFSTWLSFHPEKNLEDFYGEQKASAITIKGTIANFDQSIKNSPGNFILKGENIPLAYLYSITVDLTKFIGKQVNLSVSPRSNNNFAFPAYFVNSIE